MLKKKRLESICLKINIQNYFTNLHNNKVYILIILVEFGLSKKYCFISCVFPSRTGSVSQRNYLNPTFGVFITTCGT